MDLHWKMSTAEFEPSDAPDQPKAAPAGASGRWSRKKLPPGPALVIAVVISLLLWAGLILLLPGRL
jgi:hypothetical protein